jgi:hypothetical protein
MLKLAVFSKYIKNDCILNSSSKQSSRYLSWRLVSGLSPTLYLKIIVIFVIWIKRYF